MKEVAQLHVFQEGFFYKPGVTWTLTRRGYIGHWTRLRFYLLQLLLWPIPFNFLEVVWEILQHVKGQNAAKVFHLLFF